MDKNRENALIGVYTSTSEGTVRSGIGRLNENIVAFSGNSVSASLGNIVNIYRRFYLFGLGVVILLAVLILFKINAASLLERRKDIGVMQAVGWTKKAIAWQITFELFLQTISGFILGALVSCAVISLAGSISVQAVPPGLGRSPGEIEMPLVISPITVVRYFALTVLVSALVSYCLARKVWVMKPSENLRSL